MVMIVLLKEAWTWAIPSTTVFLTFFRLIVLAIYQSALSTVHQSATWPDPVQFIDAGLSALDGTTWALAGTCICLRLLATHRQATTMTQPAIAAQVHQSFDVHSYFAT